MGNQPTIVILAAGIGSRYGGLKQLDALGPNGECIMDYSLYDACRAGFRRAVLVIRQSLEAEFRQRFRVPGLEIEYAFQRAEDLPAGYACPQERTKPWGTGHALYAARDLLHGPFGVVGADDFYGRETFQLLYDFLAHECTPGHLGMVGHILKNTLTENGSVSRAICTVEHGMLVGIQERTKILREDGLWYEEEGKRYPLDENSVASLIVWGLHAGLLPRMEADFAAWLEHADPIKGEYFLPAFVDRMIHRPDTDMAVRITGEKWYGVTYQADKGPMSAALAAMHRDGLYPNLRAYKPPGSF